MALTPEQIDAVQHQIMALVRTHILENRSIGKQAITTYLQEIAGVQEITEHDVEEVVKGLFSTDGPYPLRALSLTQALLFSNAVFGCYDSDYSFVVICSWGQQKTTCYVVYALTASVLLDPTPVYLCTKEQALKEFLAGYKMCPSEWLPIPLEKGLKVVRKTQADVESLIATKLASLRESGPMRII